MYRDAWRLQRDLFWTEDMSAVDWRRVYDRYLPLLDRIGNHTERPLGAESAPNPSPGHLSTCALDSAPRCELNSQQPPGLLDKFNPMLYSVGIRHIEW